MLCYIQKWVIHWYFKFWVFTFWNLSLKIKCRVALTKFCFTQIFLHFGQFFFYSRQVSNKRLANWTASSYPLYTALLSDWRVSDSSPLATFVNTLANSILERFYTARTQRFASCAWLRGGSRGVIGAIAPLNFNESNIFHHDFVQFVRTLGCQWRLDYLILLKLHPLNLRAGSAPGLAYGRPIGRAGE